MSCFSGSCLSGAKIQTDPNLGNYRIRIAGEAGEEPDYDRIVLLDFGAVQSYSREFLDPVIQMIRASYEDDLEQVIEGGVKLRFMSYDWPRKCWKSSDRFACRCWSPWPRTRASGRTMR